MGRFKRNVVIVPCGFRGMVRCDIAFELLCDCGYALVCGCNGELSSSSMNTTSRHGGERLAPVTSQADGDMSPLRVLTTKHNVDTPSRHHDHNSHTLPLLITAPYSIIVAFYGSIQVLQ